MNDLDTASPPPAARRSHGLSFWLLLICAMALGASLLINLVLVAAFAMVGGGDLDDTGDLQEVIAGTSEQRVLLIPVTGVITDQREQGLFGPRPSMVEQIRSQLKRATDDDRIAAILLHIDSLGGGVSASDELYEAVRQLKQETDMPVVVHMGGLCASGGYYIASAADELIASPTTVTGSIGVIMRLFNAQELFNQKLGIRSTPIVSGPMKDIASPFDEMSEAEQAVLQGVINAMYDRFITCVANNRRGHSVFAGLDDEALEARLRELADGRIYHADKALSIGLVDAIGYQDAALARLRKLIGDTGAPLVRYRAKHGLQALLEAKLPKMPMADVLEGAHFEYRWLPGL